jgi:signal transduction histidine kinase
MRATNGDGVWDREGIVYPITQEPFFYETAVFYFSMIAVGCILLAGAYRFRLRQESARIKGRLEERLAERERIARDLHDTLLQSFQGTLLKYQAALNLLSQRPEHARRIMQEAVDSAEAAIAEGRDAIRDLRSDSGALADLPQRLSSAAEELSKTVSANGVVPAFGVTIEGPPREINPVLQDELYRIGREILRNAFGHAHAEKIEVEIRTMRRNSSSGSAMTESELTQRYSTKERGWDTGACRACANAPTWRALDWSFGANQGQARRFSLPCPRR